MSFAQSAKEASKSRSDLDIRSRVERSLYSLEVGHLSFEERGPVVIHTLSSQVVIGFVLILQELLRQ